MILHFSSQSRVKIRFISLRKFHPNFVWFQQMKQPNRSLQFQKLTFVAYNFIKLFPIHVSSSGPIILLYCAGTIFCQPVYLFAIYFTFRVYLNINL